MQNLHNLTYKTKPTKSNIPNQTYQTKLSKPNIPNQTYQTKHTKPNQTKPTKMSLPNQAKPTNPNQAQPTKHTNQTYQTQISGQSSLRVGPWCLWQCFTGKAVLFKAKNTHLWKSCNSRLPSPLIQIQLVKKKFPQ